MTKAHSVHLQLHADRDELFRLAETWREAHGLHLAAERFFPGYSVVEIEGDLRITDVQGVINRIALRDSPFDLTPTRAAEFAAQNMGSLFVVPARVIDNQLGEASISGVTTDLEQAARWRRILRQVRNQAHKGAVVRGLRSPRTRPVLSHRHTVGAHDLAERGVRMVTLPGGNEFLFDDISSSHEA